MAEPVAAWKDRKGKLFKTYEEAAWSDKWDTLSKTLPTRDEFRRATLHGHLLHEMELEEWFKKNLKMIKETLNG